MRFMRISEVIETTGLCRSSIYSLMASGDFPKPVSLGARAVAWVSGEINEWMTARIDERDFHKNDG